MPINPYRLREEVQKKLGSVGKTFVEVTLIRWLWAVMVGFCKANHLAGISVNLKSDFLTSVSKCEIM